MLRACESYHRPRASLRRPQCFSFHEPSNKRSTVNADICAPKLHGRVALVKSHFQILFLLALQRSRATNSELEPSRRSRNLPVGEPTCLAVWLSRFLHASEDQPKNGWSSRKWSSVILAASAASLSRVFAALRFRGSSGHLLTMAFRQFEVRSNALVIDSIQSFFSFNIIFSFYILK
jgi:hypothetical protein